MDENFKIINKFKINSFKIKFWGKKRNNQKNYKFVIVFDLMIPKKKRK